MALPKKVDTTLYSHILRRSITWYQNYVKSIGGCRKSKSWDNVLKSVFQRLMNASGSPSFKIQYCITPSMQFNAAAFPGGQFIINIGTLKYLEKKVQLAIKGKKKKESSNKIREQYIVGILAHELAHYYNKHTLKGIKKSWSLKKNQLVEKDLGLIKHTQNMELDADYTGFLIMQKAGYKPSDMVLTLETLNEIYQSCLKKHQCSSAIYFSSHPAPHRRLAKVKHGKQQLHKWLYKIEKAFTDVSFGRKLKESD